MFTILEDKSPYYLRFTHSGIEDFLTNSLTHLVPTESLRPSPVENFKASRLDAAKGRAIVEACPVHRLVPLFVDRVAFLISLPGLYYRAHKDGLDKEFSVNYYVKVLDESCVTSWYSDEDLGGYPIYQRGALNRECEGFQKSKHTPLCTMVARHYEGVLFNTSIFHDWDNSTSPNERILLSMRAADTKLTFEGARSVFLQNSHKSHA